MIANLITDMICPYTGSQALKALKEAGVSSVLINPNIATIQTNHFIADEIYYRKYLPRIHEAPSTHLT